MMKSGIYKISCGKRYYIGSSKNCDKRWRTHQRHLRGGYHCNQFMQNLWNKTKGHGFTFEVIIGCAEVMLRAREQELIDHYWDDRNFMNLNPHADRPAGWTRRKGRKWKCSDNIKGSLNHSAVPHTIVFTDGTEKTFGSLVDAAEFIGCGKRSIHGWKYEGITPSKKWGIKEIRHAGV